MSSRRGEILLASQSVYRREVLEQAGYRVTTYTTGIPEPEPLEFGDLQTGLGILAVMKARAARRADRLRQVPQRARRVRRDGDAAGEQHHHDRQIEAAHERRKQSRESEIKRRAASDQEDFVAIPKGTDRIEHQASFFIFFGK